MNTKFVLLLIGALASSPAIADSVQNIVVGTPWTTTVAAGGSSSFIKNGQNNFKCMVSDADALGFSATPSSDGMTLAIVVTGKTPTTGDDKPYMVCGFGAKGTGTAFFNRTFTITSS